MNIFERLNSASTVARRRRQKQRGLALVLALFAIFVISALAVAIITMSQTELLASGNFRAVTSANYGAEAGVQRAIEWLQTSYLGYASSTNLSLFNNSCSPVVISGSACGAKAVTLSSISGVAANYPDSAVQTAFVKALGNQSLTAGNGAASYSVSATLVRVRQAVDYASGQLVTVRTWRVTSLGIGGNNQADVEATALIQEGFPLVPYAVMASSAACPSITLSGGLTDAWNSTVGGYGAGNAFTAKADVATNGQVSSSGGTINGTNWVARSSPCATGFTGSPAPTAGSQILPQALSIPDPSVPSPAPSTGAQDCPSSSNPPGTQSCTTTTLQPGNYADLDIISNVTLQGGAPGGAPAVYNINSLDLVQGCAPPHGHGHGRSHSCQTNGVTVTINGPVIINLFGQGLAAGTDVLSTASGSRFVNTGHGSDLIIAYNGTAPIDVEGGNQETGLIYAPHSAVTLNGSAPWYGALVGSTVTIAGGAPVHYDTDLQNRLLQQTGTYHLLSYTRTRF